jgi:DNA end-binding protein Ku
LARAIWKGVVRVGGRRVPVRLYAAVADRAVHFRLLHAKDRTPVRQRMVNPRTGNEVPRAEIRQGYEIERGVFVRLTPADLERAEPDDTRDITVDRFVDADAVGPEWYERPYWLAPDARAAGDYAALATALGRTGKIGLAHWVMRDREHTGALRAHGEHLVLATLRSKDEVITPTDLEPPAGRPPAEKELELARQLVASLEGEFDPSAYRDEYRKRVLEFVQAKAKGRKMKLARPARRRAPASLAAALQASLRAGKRRRA